MFDRQTDGQTLIGKTALHTMQRGKNCKAFTDLSRAEMVGGGCPLLPEIFDQRDAPPSKTAHSSLYSLVAPEA